MRESSNILVPSVVHQVKCVLVNDANVPAIAILAEVITADVTLQSLFQEQGGQFCWAQPDSYCVEVKRNHDATYSRPTSLELNASSNAFSSMRRTRVKIWGRSCSLIYDLGCNLFRGNWTTAATSCWRCRSASGRSTQSFRN